MRRCRHSAYLCREVSCRSSRLPHPDRVSCDRVGIFLHYRSFATPIILTKPYAYLNGRSLMLFQKYARMITLATAAYAHHNDVNA